MSADANEEPLLTDANNELLPIVADEELLMAHAEEVLFVRKCCSFGYARYASLFCCAVNVPEYSFVPRNATRFWRFSLSRAAWYPARAQRRRYRATTPLEGVESGCRLRIHVSGLSLAASDVSADGLKIRLSMGVSGGHSSSKNNSASATL